MLCDYFCFFLKGLRLLCRTGRGVDDFMHNTSLGIVFASLFVCVLLFLFVCFIPTVPTAYLHLLLLLFLVNVTSDVHDQGFRLNSNNTA